MWRLAGATGDLRRHAAPGLGSAGPPDRRRLSSRRTTHLAKLDETLQLFQASQGQDKRGGKWGEAQTEQGAALQKRMVERVLFVCNDYNSYTEEEGRGIQQHLSPTLISRSGVRPSLNVASSRLQSPSRTTSIWWSLCCEWRGTCLAVVPTPLSSSMR